MGFTDHLTVNVSAYGKSFTISEILAKLSEEEVKDLFTSVLESLMQEGRIGNDDDIDGEESIDDAIDSIM